MILSKNEIKILLAKNEREVVALRRCLGNDSTAVAKLIQALNFRAILKDCLIESLEYELILYNQEKKNAA